MTAISKRCWVFESLVSTKGDGKGTGPPDMDDRKQPAWVSDWLASQRTGIGMADAAHRVSRR
jgi:hypothetical protein